jgi:hypothetical protein
VVVPFQYPENGEVALGLLPFFILGDRLEEIGFGQVRIINLKFKN